MTDRKKARIGANGATPCQRRSSAHVRHSPPWVVTLEKFLELQPGHQCAKCLRKVAELTNAGSKAMVSTPLKPAIQAEIDAGNLTAKAVRTGPFGHYTGEVFLALTDAGRQMLQPAPRPGAAASTDHPPEN